MKNKKSELTMLQSYRLYNGGGLLKALLVFSIGEILVYLFGVYFGLSMDACFDGYSFSEVLNELSSKVSLRDNSDPTLWIFSISLCTDILLIQQFDKSNPGGKFFRTVKGGFGTYKKYRTLLYIMVLLSAVISATAVFLLDFFGIVGLRGGIVSSIACVTSVVYSLIIFSVGIYIKRKVPAFVIGILTVVLCSVVFGSLPLKGMEVLIPIIVLLVIGMVLLPITMRAYFTYYKRVYWD